MFPNITSVRVRMCDAARVWCSALICHPIGVLQRVRDFSLLPSWLSRVKELILDVLLDVADHWGSSRHAEGEKGEGSPGGKRKGAKSICNGQN